MKRFYYVAQPNKRGARPVVVAAPRKVAPVKSHFPAYAFMTGPFKTYEGAERWRRFTITY